MDVKLLTLAHDVSIFIVTANDVYETVTKVIMGRE